jgi:hypothetical protein
MLKETLAPETKKLKEIQGTCPWATQHLWR